MNEAKRLNDLNDSLHSARCRACKTRVRELLTAIFGDCRVNHQFPWRSHPEDYADTAVGKLLEEIRCALGNWRGHRDFIRSDQMPPCDYFIPDPPFILEFDESQHFTRARLVTLGLYPVNLDSGFSLSRWVQLCREIDAQDDQPFDRDERRAWYDTLRDLVPPLHGFGPTLRLYAEAYPWCSLDVAQARHWEQFRALLDHRLPEQDVKKI